MVMNEFIIGTHIIIMMGKIRLTEIFLNSSVSVLSSSLTSSSMISGSGSKICRVYSSLPVIIINTPIKETISTAVFSFVNPFFKNMHEKIAVNNGDKFCIKLATTKGKYLMAV